MKTRKIHEKYGPVIRLSPNELAFTSVAAWNDIYGHRNGRQDLNKDPIHVGSVDPMPGVSSISMADHKTHARQRKALSHGFSKKALWEQEGIVQEFVDKLMSRFRGFAERGETFDIVKWYNFITFDVIGDLSFGESFGCLERGDFHFWITLIFDAVKAGAMQQATRRVATAGSTTQTWLMKFIPSELTKRRADHLSYSREKVMRFVSSVSAFYLADAVQTSPRYEKREKRLHVLHFETRRDLRSLAGRSNSKCSAIHVRYSVRLPTYPISNIAPVVWLVVKQLLVLWLP